MEQFPNLNSSFAHSRLGEELEKFYDERRKVELKQRKPLKTYFTHPLSILWLTCSVCLLFDFLLLQIQTDPVKWIHRESMLVESLFLFFTLLGNIWILRRELDYDSFELSKKLKALIATSKDIQWSPIQEIPIPVTRMLSLARVIRDNTLQYLPFSLLVEGDTIQLSFGDVAPAAAKLIPTGKQTRSDFHLEANQVFRPSIFHQHKVPITKISNAQQFHFVLLSTPVIDNLKITFSKSRPKTMLKNQAEKLFHVLYYKILPFVLLLSLIFNIISLSLSSDQVHTWASFLLVRQVYVIIPLLPVTLIVLWIIVRTLGNARIIILYDQLEQSTTPFDDSIGVDEFDEEAPAPTKEVKLAQAMLVGKLFKGLLHQEETHSNSLLETFSNITVICSVDRAGTIADPHPNLEQILIFEDNSNEAVVLDVTYNDDGGIIFEDKDWNTHISSLKPIGLNIILNSVSVHNPHEPHHKRYQRIAPVRLPSSLQSCQCVLARTIGFLSEYKQQYETLEYILLAAPYDTTISKNIREDSILFSSLAASIQWEKFKDTSLIVTEGLTQFILNFCTEYWNGKELVDLDSNMRKKILDFCNNALENDSECIGYSYAPISTDVGSHLNSSLSRKSLFYNSHGIEDAASSSLLQKLEQQCFLGLATLVYTPKIDVREFIEDLRVAGIRFVYFSQRGQRESKAFGERLGLETDWNSLILLSSADDPYAENSSGYLEPHDIKAKLPRGIENIRPHLKDVDDIPLHVSLFADCVPLSIQEMMNIYQEYGEVVCCYGSAMNRFNSGMFAVADISICIEPFANMKTHKALHFGAQLISLPAALMMNHSSSPYTISQIIREARKFMIGSMQGFIFVIGAELSLSLSVLLSNILLIPPIFVGYHIIWISSIIIPILMVPFLFVDDTTLDIMKLMPSKNKDHISGFWRYMGYFVIRFIPLSIFTAIVFISSVLVNTQNVLWKFNVSTWMIKNFYEQEAVIFAELVSSFTFVFSLCVISFTFLYRNASSFEIPPFKSGVWAASVLTAMILHIVFLTGLFFANDIRLSSLSWVFALVFTLPIVLIANQELAKSMEKKQFNRFQKRSKLEFNTKLGCYSPV